MLFSEAVGPSLPALSELISKKPWENLRLQGYNVYAHNPSDMLQVIKTNERFYSKWNDDYFFYKEISYQKIF